MHRIILLILLGTLSYSANAEWVELFNDGSLSNDVMYADPSTIRRRPDNTAEISELFSYRTPVIGNDGGFWSSDKKYLSFTSLVEFKCDKPQYRLLNPAAYAYDSRQADIVITWHVSDKWKAATAGTFQWEMQVGICATDPQSGFVRLINRLQEARAFENRDNERNQFEAIRQQHEDMERLNRLERVRKVTDKPTAIVCRIQVVDGMMFGGAESSFLVIYDPVKRTVNGHEIGSEWHDERKINMGPTLVTSRWELSDEEFVLSEKTHAADF